MSIDAAEYARLAADSYEDRSKWVGSPDSFALNGSNTATKSSDLKTTPRRTIKARPTSVWTPRKSSLFIAVRSQPRTA